MNKPVQGRSQYLPSLTGLRFFLGFWVVLHHLVGQGMMLEPIAEALPAPLAYLIRDGYLAVQSFFILSGFVLARSCTEKRWTGQSLTKFGIARVARIYPVYIASLAIVAPFIFDAMRKPTRTLAIKTWLLTTYAFVLQGWTGSMNVGWNTPAWSLSCEFFFYLSFPLLFIWLKNARRSQLAIAIGCSLILPITLAHAGVPYQLKPIYHFADFVMGISAAELYSQVETRWAGRGYWLYIPAALIGTVYLVNPGLMTGILSDPNTLLRPLNAAALIGLALGGGFAARFLAGKWIEYLGKVSYSMYILHVPVLWWFNRFATDREHNGHVDGILLYLATVMIVSVAAFEWIETPANRWIRQRTAAVRRSENPSRAESPERYGLARQPVLS